MDGEFRKHLAVEEYAEFGQSVDELTVAQAFGSAGGVDANNPKCAEYRLLFLAVAISVSFSMFHCILRIAKEAGLVAEVALGFL